MGIIIFLYLLFFAFLTKIRLDWAVLFLIFALPSYLIRFKIFGIPTTILEVMIWLVFLSWVIFHTEFFKYFRGQHGVKYFFEQKKQRMPYPFGKEIIILLIISFLAVAVSGFSNSALGVWKAYFFEPILLFVVVLNVFQGQEKMKKILWSLAMSAFLVSLLSVWQKMTGSLIFNDFWSAEETRRSVSFFGYPNAIGLYLGPLCLLFFGWLLSFLNTEKKEKISYSKIFFIALTLLLSLLSIYFAKSEGALIGVMGGLVIFGLLADRRIKRITIVAIFIFLAGIVGHESTRNYVIQKITLQDLSGQIRLQQWEETWEMLGNGKMIMGTGLSGYQKAVQPYHQEGIFFNRDNDPDFHRKTVFNEEYRKKYWQPVETYLYPHNIFLNFWSELGLVGLLLFIWIIGKFFYLGYKNKENNFLILGLIGAMIVIVVHGLVDVPYFKNDLSVMFWIFVAMVGIINLEVKKYGKNV